MDNIRDTRSIYIIFPNFPLHILKWTKGPKSLSPRLSQGTQTELTVALVAKLI